ncbi:MAG: hypothetical protein IPL27_25525 [Lewinellaceae bacterium]|nr:hypothetical protein [Lewinellaceae bacterium]
MFRRGARAATAEAVRKAAFKLENYTDIKAVANSGQLYTVVTRATNWMPKGGQKLDACTTDKLKAWIDAGALNN